MQKRRTKDEYTFDSLSILQSRILAMSFVHESLHQHEQQLSSPAGLFINTFVRHIQALNNGTRIAEVSCETDEHILLSADKVICLSLIINEVMTNSYKYTQCKTLIISLSLHMENNCIILLIRDNGNLEPDPGFMDKGMGMKIITAMCEKLQATHMVTYENGLSHHIEFKA
jgi:two-component sensor histidine kinase